MKKEILIFNRDCGPDDWSALPQPFKKGDRLTRFYGHTYGLDRDDLLFGGVSSIPCTLDGHSGFFTVPAEWLTDEHGNPVYGAYIHMGSLH